MLALKGLDTLGARFDLAEEAETFLFPFDFGGVTSSISDSDSSSDSELQLDIDSESDLCSGLRLRADLILDMLVAPLSNIIIQQ